MRIGPPLVCQSSQCTAQGHHQTDNAGIAAVVPPCQDQDQGSDASRKRTWGKRPPSGRQSQRPTRDPVFTAHPNVHPNVHLTSVHVHPQIQTFLI
jgi:hypothetical protein